MKKYFVSIYLVLLSAAPAVAFADNNSLWVFSGEAALNGGTTQKQFTTAYQIEQDTTNWDLGYLNEGNLQGRKRDGMFGMRRFGMDLNDRLETSVAVGPYFSATTVEGVTNTTNFHYKYDVSMLTALSLRFHATKTIDYQLRYQHVVISSDGKDTDQLFVGVGYAFK